MRISEYEYGYQHIDSHFVSQIDFREKTNRSIQDHSIKHVPQASKLSGTELKPQKVLNKTSGTETVRLLHVGTMPQHPEITFGETKQDPKFALNGLKKTNLTPRMDPEVNKKS